MTLAQLRDLLTRAYGPAVEREPEGNRSPAGLARVYLGHEVADLLLRDEAAAEAVWSSWSLARRTQAAKVGLALALGLDPGPMGCAVSWRYGAWGWVLRGEGSSYIMSATTEEPDAIKALVLAAEHVLATS